MVYNVGASKVMLKILQAKLQQYMNQELPDIQTEGTRSKRDTCTPMFITALFIIVGSNLDAHQQMNG